MKHYYALLFAGVIILQLGVGCTQPQPQLKTVAEEAVVEEATTVNITVEPELVELEPEPVVLTKTFNTSDLADLDTNFNFSVEIPAQWEVENVVEIQSLNFYDPSAVGDTNLDRSQIFVRYFLAQEFLTLDTVTIHASTELTINDHEAMEYDIEKKSAVADFASQPAWRNQRHIVTDIRVSTNSLVFYVFGQRPGLDLIVLDQFFKSLIFTE